MDFNIFVGVDLVDMLATWTTNQALSAKRDRHIAEKQMIAWDYNIMCCTSNRMHKNAYQHRRICHKNFQLNNYTKMKHSSNTILVLRQQILKACTNS